MLLPGSDTLDDLVDRGEPIQWAPGTYDPNADHSQDIQPAADVAAPVDPQAVDQVGSAGQPAQPAEPLLPPPVQRTEQPHSGRDAAIDIDAFYSRQTPEVRAIMDQGFQTNPPMMKKRLADVLYMAEQTGIPAQHILYNFDQIRDGFAAQQGWMDVNGDDDVMHGHIVKKATAERDHDVSLHGMEGDNATARTAREQSMQNRGYMAGVGTLGAKGGGVKYNAFGNPEDINPADAQPGSSSFDEDPLKAFERSEKNHPKLDQSPRARAERWHVFFGAYAQGNQDLTVAKAAAHEAYPYFEEGGDISKALPILRNLTPQQLTLAVREMGRGADQKPADDREALGKGIDAAGRAAAMLGRGIARFMQAGEQAGLGFVAGQTVDAEALAKGPQALVDNELERSHMNTGGFGAGAMPINPRNPVALTKEQAAEANKYVEGIKKDRNLLEQMQKIADGTVNPINADSVLQRMAITIGESLPVMGTAMIPVIGPVAVGAAFASDATENLISQGVSRNTAEGLGVVIGGIQAFGAVFTPKAFIKIPWLNNIFGNFSTSAVIRGIQRVGLGSAEGAAVATLANVTGPQLVQKIAHEFDPAVPTWSFGEIAKESWNSTSSAIIDFAPIVFLGAGFAHVSDMRAAKEIAQDRVKMTALGFDPKDVEAVMAAQDNNSAKDALMKGYARRKPILPGDSRAASLKESAERVKNMRPEDFPPGEAVPAEINQVDAEARARAAAQEAGISVHMDEDGWHVGEAGKEPTNVGDDAKGALQARDTLTAEKQAEENAAFGEEMDKTEKEQREPSDEEFNKSVKALTEGGEKPNEEKENAAGQTEEVPGEEIAPMHQQGREVPEIALAAPEAVKEGEGAAGPEVADTRARETVEGVPAASAARASEKSGAGLEGPSEPVASESAGGPVTKPPGLGGTATAESGNRGNTTHAELEATAKEFGVELPKGEEKWKVRDEMAKAKAVVDANPRAGEDLLAELKKKPRPVDKTERFIINHEGMKREAALAEAAAKMNDDNLPESEREAAKARFEIADERWQEFHDYVARAGSLAGSSMGAIRFAQSKDFTLAGIRSYVRAKFNNGKKFEGKRGKEMEAKIKELHAELARTSQKVAEYEAKEKAAAEKKEADDAARAEKKGAADEVADRVKKAKAAKRKPTTKRMDEILADRQRAKDDLSRLAKESMGSGNMNFGDPHIAGAMLRLLSTYVAEGIHRASELLKKLAEAGIKISEEQLRKFLPAAREMTKGRPGYAFKGYQKGSAAETNEFGTFPELPGHSMWHLELEGHPSHGTTFRITGENPTHDELMAEAERTAQVTAPLPPRQEEPQQRQGFYSQAEKVVLDKLPPKASPEQIEGLLRNPQSRVSEEELKWSGVIPWLKEQGKSVTREAVLGFLREQGVVKFEENVSTRTRSPEEIQEAVDAAEAEVQKQEEIYNRLLSEGWTEDQYDSSIHAQNLQDAGDARRLAHSRRNQTGPVGPRFAKYQLPGGENYKETVLEMPGIAKDDFKTAHFPESNNYVAHMRTNERADASGQPGLFIEEIQSDRHQAAREHGYAGDEVSGLVFAPGRHDASRKTPDAPFRQSWPLQMFKRALRDAVATGKKWIGWTTGETQAERYDLSKQVDRLEWSKMGDNSYALQAWRGKDILFSKSDLSAQDVGDHVGKDLGRKITESNTEEGELKGLDLKVGGEGMKGFYDQILPKEIQKYVRQWGARTEEGKTAEGVPFHKVEITPEMEETVASEGQPLFTGGETQSLTKQALAALKKTREESQARLKQLGQLGSQLGAGQGVAELIYHSAKIAATGIAELGLHGVELGEWLLKEMGSLGGKVAEKAKEHLQAIIDLAETEAGITAYQGSPHDFDNPSMEHVGSGEGNQNQGHGLYYADSESVGKWYREMTGSEEKPGNLYKVHIAANHDEFLNLDLAIRDQSPEIQKAAEAAGLLSYSPPTKEQAKILSDHGVPGVRYPNFDGTGHNYVVFDESLVRHLEKNGEPVTPTTEGVRRMQIAIEKFKAIKEGAWQDLKNAGKVDASGRMFSGAEKLPEMIWHAARFAVGVAGEYGLKGAELAARVIEELGELGGWAKEHIKGIMDLAESMRHQEASDELIKSVGEKTAKEEDAQRREEIKTQRAEKKVQRDKEKADIAAIKDAGKRAAKEEDFVRRVQKEDDLAEKEDREEAEKAAKFQKDLEDKAAKIASDELIKEVGDEIGEPKDFARRVAAEGAKRDRELESFQKAVDKRVKDLRERMTKEDFSPRKRKTFEDPEKAKILADRNGAVLEYERAKVKWEMENRSTQQKVFDAVGDWKTSAVLAGAPVIVKLSAAASTMIAVTPAENLIGGAIGLLPGIRQVALKAPRHGRFSYSAEAHAIAETWRNFFKDMNDIRKKGKTEYELNYENGEKVTVGKGLGEYLSRLHAILKSPAKRNEFARSFAYRVEYYSRQGVTDKEMASKEWQMRIGTEALKDAKHQLLMNDNVFTDKWRQFWSGIEKHAQNLEKEGTIGSVGAAMIRVAKLAANWDTPIVRIPTNLVARICEYAFGSIPGAARLGVAIVKGVQNLPPEQADLVMRNLKRGSVGLALMIIAYHNPQMFGGYFQRGQYPDENDPDFGEMTIGGYRLPKTLMHHPLLQVMQFAATMRKISDEPEHRHSEETKGDISGLKGAMLGLMEEIPFANEVKHLAQAMDEHDKHSFWGETLKSAIPQVIQQVAGWMDPTKKGFLNENAQKERSGKPVTRAPQGIWETINSGIPTIPGLRNVLPGRNAIPTTEDRKHMPRR